MKVFLPLTTEEQLTAFLRDEILRGGLRGKMPGVLQLAGTLGTSPRTVAAAVARLVNEGFLSGQGRGRPCQILIPKAHRSPGLRVAILLYEMSDRHLSYIIELKHQLEESGHVVDFSRKSQVDLQMDLKRVTRFVQNTEADAWVVISGSLMLLEWFAAQPFPAIGLFGRMMDKLPMVFPDKKQAMAVAMKRLISLGHRRIVLLVREERRKPQPGFFEQNFLRLLESEGIKTSSYNLPDWQESVAGLNRCLDSLFRHTPPTALIIDQSSLFVAALLHLAQKGIVPPKGVSMMSLDPDPSYFWCDPPISHIDWDNLPLVRGIVKWVNNLSLGKRDNRKTWTPARFVPGGTIGPLPRS